MRRKRNLQGVSTPAAFPPRTLDPNQDHGAPTTQPLPFLPPRNGETWRGSSRQETPAWLHSLCLLSGAEGQKGRAHTAVTTGWLTPQNSFVILPQIAIPNLFAFSPVSPWPQPWVVLSQLLRAGLHGAGAEEISVCLVSVSKAFGPQPQQLSSSIGSELTPGPPNLCVLVCKRLFTPPPQSLSPHTAPKLSVRKGECTPAGRALD